MKTESSSELSLVVERKKDDSGKMSCPEPCGLSGSSYDIPSFELRGEALKRWEDKFGPVETGEEYEVTLRVRISSRRREERTDEEGNLRPPDPWSNCATFQVREVIGDVVEEENPDHEKDEKGEEERHAKMKKSSGGNKAVDRLAKEVSGYKAKEEDDD